MGNQKQKMSKTLVQNEYTALNPIKKNDYKTRMWDMTGKDHIYFIEKLKTCFELDWFEKKETHKIREQFEKILVGPQQHYCVILGHSPTYMIQAKKNSVLNIIVADLAIFIFLPKQIDIPVLKRINLFQGDA